MTQWPGEPADETERIVELREEVQQLKEAVTSHAVVDQAIGMMVALGRVAPDEAWAVLREVSQHTDLKLRRVAELILLWGSSGEIPAEIREELEAALDRHGPTQVPEADPDDGAYSPLWDPLD
ncbi:ANTAR domain-containing protein [Streptomyces sp. enrichment culture]|uniref:ANTAR domain-containing protein n=1 Tax=Streptomyces sp. enrichment culture TaxID=1795815 RepID=UPI003F56875F